MSSWFLSWLRRHDVTLYGVSGRHYRCGTVPHTGKSKSSHHYWRYMRTTQERRRNEADARDGDLYLNRRNKLPSVWDDRHVMARNNRNWKEFRLNRWKDQV